MVMADTLDGPEMVVLDTLELKEDWELTPEEYESLARMSAYESYRARRQRQDDAWSAALAAAGYPEKRKHYTMWDIGVALLVGFGIGVLFATLMDVLWRYSA
jgi:hypothetical protein